MIIIYTEESGHIYCMNYTIYVCSNLYGIWSSCSSFSANILTSTEILLFPFCIYMKYRV